jgi:hypothetical protein
MNRVRGLVAVAVGLAITLVFVQMLESMLAVALVGHPLRSLDEYVPVLMTPPILIARFLFTIFVAILGGYVCAKIAAHDELRYTAIAAIFRAIMLIWAFVAGSLPATPIWMFVPLLAVSSAGMMGGAAVRAAAASIRRKQELST